MTRTDAREIAVRLLYSLAVTGQEPEALLDAFFGDGHFETLGGEDELFARCPDKKQMAYIRSLVTLCAEHRETLDDYIKKYSKGWKPERISKTAAAVLRCALCEILYLEDVPDSAAINEAVELAKRYDEQDTVAFINGVLGGFMRGEKGNAAVPEGAEPVPPEAEALQENE
ncbi:MAG TPA: transcription antitermination factor NusB [Clostridiales bacterium]|nr:transcription antitermination factor NusB [Clostridiales bacterium]